MVEWLLATGYWSPCIRRSPTVAAKERGGSGGGGGGGGYDPHDTSRRSNQVAPKCPNQHLRLLRYAFQETKGEELAFETAAAKKGVDVSFEGRFSRMSWSGMWGRPVRTGCELMRRFP